LSILTCIDLILTIVNIKTYYNTLTDHSLLYIFNIMPILDYNNVMTVIKSKKIESEYKLSMFINHVKLLQLHLPIAFDTYIKIQSGI